MYNVYVVVVMVVVIGCVTFKIIINRCCCLERALGRIFGTVERGR